MMFAFKQKKIVEIGKKKGGGGGREKEEGEGEWEDMLKAKTKGPELSWPQIGPLNLMRVYYCL